jgi:hypothetical protein
MVMTMVELFATTRRYDLLDEAMQIFKQQEFSMCVGSHTACVFEMLDQEKFSFPAYYAPLNKIGFFMFPTKVHMMRVLSKMRKPLIAIKPLAGGRIHPKEAFEYIYNQKKDTICMVGLSSIQEIRDAITAFHHVNW